MATGKYKEWLEKDNLILLQGWRRDGLSYAQIAANIGISEGTLNNWCLQHGEIREALKKGEEVCVYEVENALYKSAIGHFVEEIEMVETTTPMGINTTKKKHRRYIPPNTAAQIFILKNRRPDWWKDKREIENTDSTVDDGFLKALEGTAEDDWDETESTDSV